MRTRRFVKNVSKYLIGKDVQYLEIGVFRGSTIKWVSEVTGPKSKCIGVDPWEFKLGSRRIFPDDTHGKAKWAAMISNLRKIQHSSKGKIQLIKGYSQEVLPYKFKKNQFDFIYVDGHHTIHAVMRDFCMAWPLLKVGGVMNFDDYLMRNSD